ncbi:hypothetical protein B566_EDAN017909 [Ephemera danica]|nr:hypothetical protein B566_EDAN017909 [Ephemera danica]
MADLQRPLKYANISEFFQGRCVFITGATGFMGKVLVEKLLRSCPELDTLYLLMRPKRGQLPEQRLKELIAGPAFERLRQESPGVFSKLRVVPGDVSEDKLGIQETIWNEVKSRATLVFHCAACVRFDMTLRYAVTYNTQGTKRVLDTCKEIQNLEALVLLGNLPNTYAYTKCLSEKLVTEASSCMPVAIARPSIVTSSYLEPMPGYVDNLNGPTGLMLGAGKGVLRSMHCKPSYHADLIPVDIACNGLIAIAWQLANRGMSDEPLVVNLTAPESSRISWGEVIELGRRHINKYPFSGAVWYPDGSIKNSRLTHEACVVLFHIIPAYLIDGLAVLCRQKPFAQLPIEEQEKFNTDASRVDYDAYMREAMLGTRKYILKDDLSTLPKARRHMRRLYYLDKAVRVLFYLMMFWVLYSCYDAVAKVFTSPNSRISFFPAVAADVAEEPEL